MNSLKPFIFIIVFIMVNSYVLPVKSQDTIASTYEQVLEHWKKATNSYKMTGYEILDVKTLSGLHAEDIPKITIHKSYLQCEETFFSRYPDARDSKFSLESLNQESDELILIQIRFVGREKGLQRSIIIPVNKINIKESKLFFPSFISCDVMLKENESGGISGNFIDYRATKFDGTYLYDKNHQVLGRILF